MKKLNVRYFIILSALSALNVSGVSRITNLTATATTTYNSARVPLYAVNGAGLTGDQHTAAAADNVAWMCSSGQVIADQWFVVDFGAQTPLSSMRLWNFNWKHPSVDTLARGINAARIFSSTSDAAPGNDFDNSDVWTLIDSVNFAKAPGVDSYTGEPAVDLTGYVGRWLAIDILSNHGGDSVGISELHVFADERPVVKASVPDAVGASQAELTGLLAYDGGKPTEVYAFLGTTDGGTVSSAWDQVFYMHSTSAGPLSTNVAVAAGTEYFFCFQAINADGTNWSETVSFYTGNIAVEMPADISEGDFILPVTFRRPAGVTNSTLVLDFTISGDVLEGLDYIPASGTVELPAGSESVQVDISLVDDLVGEPDEQLTVALSPGPFIADASATNSTIIIDNDGFIDISQWKFHMSATFTGYSGTTPLALFPCAIRLSESIPGFYYSDFSSPSDGGDLRVTDSATGQVLLHEIDTWDPSGTSVVWVSVASLTGTVSSVELHWGKPDEFLPGYALGGGIWSSGFEGVWHLSEPSALDSTVNGNDGTAHDNSTDDGILGSGQFFDGNDYVQVPHSTSLGGDVTSSLTLSLWLNSKEEMPSTNDFRRLLEKGDCYFLLSGYGSKGGSTFLVKQGGDPVATGNGLTVPSNEWHYACGTYDGNKLRMYYDGVFKSETVLVGGMDEDGLPLRIGSDDSGKYFHGTLDETRIESTVRSADWIKACYDNQREDSAFVTFSQVDAPPSGTLIMLR